MFTIMLLDIEGLLSSPRCIDGEVNWKIRIGITHFLVQADPMMNIHVICFRVCVILNFFSLDFGKLLRGRISHTFNSKMFRIRLVTITVKATLSRGKE